MKAGKPPSNFFAYGQHCCHANDPRAHRPQRLVGPCPIGPVARHEPSARRMQCKRMVQMAWGGTPVLAGQVT